jgi:hypothetical protein
LEFFDITKRLVWPNIKTKKNKIKRIDRRVCFAKHTLDPKQIGPVRPKARAQLGLNCFWFFYGWIKLSCTSWARLQLGQTPAGLAWSLAQVSEPVGSRHSCVNYSHMLYIG